MYPQMYYPPYGYPYGYPGYPRMSLVSALFGSVRTYLSSNTAASAPGYQQPRFAKPYAANPAAAYPPAGPAVTQPEQAKPYAFKQTYEQPAQHVCCESH